MDFAEPQWMQLAVVLTPLMGLFLVWAWRRKRSALRLFIRSRLMDELTVGLSWRRQQMKAVLWVAGLACVLLSLGRPLWGYGDAIAQATGRDIVVCVDVSRSMMATDAAPSRLARAKLACYDLLSVSKSDRIGLVAFAGSAFLQCPLALDEAIQAFSTDSGTRKAVILITDGEDHEELAESAARRLSAAGINLFTVGVGTPRGELLKTSDPYGNAIFLKDEDGNPVKSLLNESLLQRLAEAAHGFYLPLQSSRTMATLYERGIAPMEAVRFSSTTVRSRIERFQWPLGLGIVLLLVELLLPGASKAAGRLPQGSVIQAGAVAAMVLVLLAGLPQAHAASDDALDRYRKGEFEASRQEYERLAREKPDDFRLRFNAGAAAYRMDDFDGAAGLFEQVLRSPDLGLQQQGWYNLGNARYRAGEAEQDPDKKREQWQQALSSYTAALKLNPGDPSAQANYQAVKQAIETMPTPPPQQGGGQQKDSKKDQKQDKQDQKQDSKDSKDGSESDSQDSQSGQKNGQKNGKDSQKSQNPSEGDSSKQQQSPQGQKEGKKQEKEGGKGEKSDKQDGAQSQGQSGEQQGKKPGEGRQGKPSAAGAKPGQESGDRRGEGAAGAEAGEPDKDARQGELMTIREAEKVLDGQKGAEKALIFRRRGSPEIGEGAGKSARRKAW